VGNPRDDKSAIAIQSTTLADGRERRLQVVELHLASKWVEVSWCFFALGSMAQTNQISRNGGRAIVAYGSVVND
jgi:hypothetical protein